jgi:hypothetical protein
MPDVDHAGSLRVYVNSTIASHANAATTINHHDSRTSRSKRGEGVGSTAARRTAAAPFRRTETVSFLLKNITLNVISHVVHYTPIDAL